MLWALHDDLPTLYGDPLAVWRDWAGAELAGTGIAAGHHLAEEAPEALAEALKPFLASAA